MTTANLREYFMQEHKRDKKYTFLNYVVICLCILLVLGLIAFLFIGTGASVSKAVSEAFGGGENAPGYVKYLFVAIFAGCVLYPFYHIWKMSKRPQEIEELLNKVDAGKNATTIYESKEYKVTLPLLKVNLKFCPITYAIIYLEGETKSYRLPINNMYIADMKILLSGANMQQLTEIKQELYAEDALSEQSATDIFATSEQEQNIINTPIKPLSEFRAFLDENIKDTLQGMDKHRKKTRNLTIGIAAVVLILIIGIAGYYIYSSIQATLAGDYENSTNTQMIIPFIIVICLVTFVYSAYARWKHKKEHGGNNDVNPDIYATGAAFNEVVFGKIINFINPTVDYMPVGHIGLPEFLESGLFEERNYDINGNDQIVGRHNGVPFIMCELWVTYRRNFSSEKEEPDNVFSGQYFVAKFNKTFSSPVYIKPRKGFKGFIDSDSVDSYTQHVGEKVRLEDPEFMEMFNVYGTDQVEARYILTPSMMERIKNLARRTKGQFYIVFNNNKITIANNSRNSKFGVGYFESLTKNNNKLLIDFYENISDQFAAIDDLKLNVKIWK